MAPVSIPHAALAYPHMAYALGCLTWILQLIVGTSSLCGAALPCTVPAAAMDICE